MIVDEFGFICCCRCCAPKFNDVDEATDDGRAGKIV
jgi:hypothetical protein